MSSVAWPTTADVIWNTAVKETSRDRAKDPFDVWLAELYNLPEGSKPSSDWSLIA